MLGGIVAQMGSLCCVLFLNKMIMREPTVFILFFIGCGIEFFLRVHFRAPARILVVPTTPKFGKLSMRDMNVKYMIASLCSATVCVLIR